MEALQSEMIDKLAAALSKVQAALKPVHKNREVEVTTKNGGSYKYSFADYEACWDAARELLTANGLSVSQPTVPTDQGILLRTVLMHSSGQWVAGLIPLMFDHTSMQSFGSAQTFARRYGFCSLIGLVSETDDDGAAGKTHQHGSSSKHVNGSSQNGQSPNGHAHREPTSGKQLYAWSRDQSRECGHDVTKFLERYGDKNFGTNRIGDFTVDQVKQSLRAAKKKIESLLVEAHGDAYEAPDNY